MYSPSWLRMTGQPIDCVFQVVAIAQVAATAHAQETGYGQKFATLANAEIDGIQKVGIRRKWGVSSPAKKP